MFLFFYFLFLFASAAAAAASGIFGTAGAAVRAADAFFAAFFGLIDVPARKAEDNGKDSDNDYIFHKDCSFLF